VRGAELTGESHGSGGGTDSGEEMRQPVTVVGRSVMEEEEEVVGCLEAAETRAESKNGDEVARWLPDRNRGEKRREWGGGWGVWHAATWRRKGVR
jgi:hypothetical protein